MTTPLEAGSAAMRAGAHGARARYEPNLPKPTSPRDPWPVSDHTVVRLEAWAIDSCDSSADAVEALLAGLPGVGEHGHFYARDLVTTDRRPYAWVLLPGDGGYCSHSVERWTRGRRYR